MKKIAKFHKVSFDEFENALKGEFRRQKKRRLRQSMRN